MKIIKTTIGLIFIGLAMLLMGSFTSPQGLGHGQNPVIKKLSTFNGDEFAAFAELRIQHIKFDALGSFALDGEPYEALINVNYITMVHRWEDPKGNDYSCLVYFNYLKEPLMIRMSYKDVVSSIKKAAEAQIK